MSSGTGAYDPSCGAFASRAAPDPYDGAPPQRSWGGEPEGQCLYRGTPLKVCRASSRIQARKAATAGRSP